MGCGTLMLTGLPGTGDEVRVSYVMSPLEREMRTFLHDPVVPLPRQTSVRCGYEVFGKGEAYLIRLIERDNILRAIECRGAVDNLTEYRSIPVHIHGDSIDTPEYDSGVIRVDANLDARIQIPSLLDRACIQMGGRISMSHLIKGNDVIRRWCLDICAQGVSCVMKCNTTVRPCDLGLVCLPLGTKESQYGVVGSSEHRCGYPPPTDVDDLQTDQHVYLMQLDSGIRKVFLDVW